MPKNLTAFFRNGKEIAVFIRGSADGHYGFTVRPVGGISALTEAFRTGKKVKWVSCHSQKEKKLFAQKPFKILGVTFYSRKEAYKASRLFGKKYADRNFQNENEIIKALRSVSREMRKKKNKK